eukprot:UN23773
MYTVLHKAIRNCQLKVVHFLLTRDADLTRQNEIGNDALKMAQERCRLYKYSFETFHILNMIELKLKDELPDHPPDRPKDPEELKNFKYIKDEVRRNKIISRYG